MGDAQRAGRRVSDHDHDPPRRHAGVCGTQTLVGAASMCAPMAYCGGHRPCLKRLDATVHRRGGLPCSLTWSRGTPAGGGNQWPCSFCWSAGGFFVADRAAAAKMCCTVVAKPCRGTLLKTTQCCRMRRGRYGSMSAERMAIAQCRKLLEQRVIVRAWTITARTAMPPPRKPSQPPGPRRPTWRSAAGWLARLIWHKGCAQTVPRLVRQPRVDQRRPRREVPRSRGQPPFGASP